MTLVDKPFMLLIFEVLQNFSLTIGPRTQYPHSLRILCATTCPIHRHRKHSRHQNSVGGFNQLFSIGTFAHFFRIPGKKLHLACSSTQDSACALADGLRTDGVCRFTFHFYIPHYFFSHICALRLASLIWIASIRDWENNRLACATGSPPCCAITSHLWASIGSTATPSPAP